MKYMEDLKEMLCKELEEIAQKGELSAGALDTVQKLTSSIKNIDKIEMLEEGGYSEDGGWEARGMYGDGMSYDGGTSYRGRKRDRMGRYSREGSYAGGNSYEGRGGNRGGNRGYSRADAKDHMIGRLEDMMEETENPREKEAFKRFIESMRNA